MRQLKLSWWTSVLLWFKPIITVYDTETGGLEWSKHQSVIRFVSYKLLNGQMYVLGEGKMSLDRKGF